MRYMLVRLPKCFSESGIIVSAGSSVNCGTEAKMHPIFGCSRCGANTRRTTAVVNRDGYVESNTTRPYRSAQVHFIPVKG